jgi:hydroxymethylpyrimidine pyrophosphatase-like HAD family hydrolase
MNGSEVVDVESERVVHGRYLDPHTRGLVRGVLSSTGLGPVLFRSRRLDYDQRFEPRSWYLSSWTEDLLAHAALLDGPAWEGSAEDLLAVGMIGHTDAVGEARAALREGLTDEYETVLFNAWDGESFLKVRHGTEDKGTALARLAADRGYTAAEAVAVGDWLNDLPMLKVAGRSFAMGGTHELVRQAATDVLDAPRGAGGAIAEVARKVWDLDV